MRFSSDALAIIAITYIDTVGGRGYAEAKYPVVHFVHLSFLWFLRFSLLKEHFVFNAVRDVPQRTLAFPLVL